MLNKLNRYVLLKPWSLGCPHMYLGMKLKQMQLHNGIWAWSKSPSKYVKQAVRIWEEYVAKQVQKGYRLLKGTHNLFKSGYFLKLDVSSVF